MKSKITRKSIISSLIVVCLLGALFGSYIYSMLKTWMKMDNANITICVILFIIFILMLWLPSLLDTASCTSVDEQSIQMMPPYKHFKKISIIFYFLLHGDLKPYVRCIPLTSIQSCTFTFTRKWGAYAYSRYTLLLKMHVGEEVVILYINPMDNGVFLPSGQGGMAFLYIKTHEEIVNLVQYFIAAGIDVQDPYRLMEALKDPSTVLYDYLETFQKNILF